jgi:protoporphyrinogen oxidase
MNNQISNKKAIIIGAGPAGLTAAYELLIHTNIHPIIIEMTDDMGGISKTVNYKGNRIDIGGHRFFSKSERVMEWWQHILPIQNDTVKDSFIINYQGKEKSISSSNNNNENNKNDKVFLIRNRVSRIYFLQKFFNYPISLSLKTLSNLGLFTAIKIGISYLFIRLFPISKEITLEDFFINRFGKTLYLTFFKDYTEKVWGVSCKEIPAEWGAQRVKGVSVWKAIKHAVFSNKVNNQKNTETSLIENFLYPKLGPGQLWEEVASIIKLKGGEIITNSKAINLLIDNNQVKNINIVNLKTGIQSTINGDYFFSTMPVKELINCISPSAPKKVLKVANGLLYRDFITVGLLLENLKIKNNTSEKTINNLIPDNWIYIQDKSVKLGRLQIFNNWSPFLVNNPNHVWLGLEYFCNEGDSLWQKSDDDFIKFAVDELISINIIDRNSVLDSTIIKMPKTYPAYFGSYNQFDEIRNYTDCFENLFLIGRNGMHKYNNQDHSMLTAMTAVENIKNNITIKDNIWAVNTEQEYHEES